MRHVEVAVIGGGLAGTTLTWRLLEAGIDTVLIDDQQPVTSSRIAAGLLTPITGKRFAIAWEWGQCYEAAAAFYRDIEVRTRSQFFRELPMVRLFQSDEERNFFQARRTRIAQHLTITDPSLDSGMVKSDCGGFEMIGGKLDVLRYLSASHSVLTESGHYLTQQLHIAQEMKVDGTRVAIPAADLTARRVILCLGASQLNSSFFPEVRFNPCKGEILTIRSPAELNQVIHQAVWVAPEGDSSLKVGATYDWDDLTREPTRRAAETLQRQLKEFFLPDFEVLLHQAAVRPTMHDFRPVIGIHPHRSCLGIMNGLGSKGSLMAPRLAKMLVEQLVHDVPIPLEVSLARWFA